MTLSKLRRVPASVVFANRMIQERIDDCLAKTILEWGVSVRFRIIAASRSAIFSEVSSKAALARASRNLPFNTISLLVSEKNVMFFTKHSISIRRSGSRGHSSLSRYDNTDRRENTDQWENTDRCGKH